MQNDHPCPHNVQILIKKYQDKGLQVTTTNVCSIYIKTACKNSITYTTDNGTINHCNLMTKQREKYTRGGRVGYTKAYIFKVSFNYGKFIPKA